MLGTIDQIFFNKYGQGLIDNNSFRAFFSSLSIDEKRDYLEGAMFLIMQSKPNNNDIEEAIKESQLKKTYTPCVLLMKGVANHNLEKIIALPDAELEKGLILFLSLFKVAYSKRFMEEKNNPDKWWYWDLSQPNIEEVILKNY